MLSISMITLFTLVLSITIFIVVIILVIGNFKITQLTFISANNDLTHSPMISIIVPIRNEEKYLEQALTSVCTQNYPNFEVIAVNDRSTDDSSNILKKLKSQFANLSIDTIDQLPPGWLGKTNALATGVEKARGEYYLFADADVIMAPSLLKRATNLMRRNKLSHLTLTPNFIMHTPKMKLFMLFQHYLLLMFFQPWKMKQSQSNQPIGIGFFNLVTKEAYDKIGGMSSIALHPVDDVALAQQIKKNGLRQEYAYGGHLLQVEWYNSLSAASNGFEKNIFACFDYNIIKYLCGMITYFLIFFIPIFEIVTTSKLSFMLSVFTYLQITISLVFITNTMKINPVYAFLYPFGAAISIFICTRAVLLTLLRRGIKWRNTFYSLEELKKFNS